MNTPQCIIPTVAAALVMFGACETLTDDGAEQPLVDVQVRGTDNLRADNISTFEIGVTVQGVRRKEVTFKVIGAAIDGVTGKSELKLTTSPASSGTSSGTAITVRVGRTTDPIYLAVTAEPFEILPDPVVPARAHADSVRAVAPRSTIPLNGTTAVAITALLERINGRVSTNTLVTFEAFQTDTSGLVPVGAFVKGPTVGTDTAGQAVNQLVVDSTTVQDPARLIFVRVTTQSDGGQPLTQADTTDMLSLRPVPGS